MMGLVRRACQRRRLAQARLGGGRCQVMDESHICFIHSWAASCYNNSGGGGKMRGSLPREAGRRVREMLTTPRAHSRYGFRSRWPGSGAGQDGPEVLTGNLLPLISCPAARQMDPRKNVFTCSSFSGFFLFFFLKRRPPQTTTLFYVFFTIFSFKKARSPQSWCNVR